MKQISVVRLSMDKINRLLAMGYCVRIIDTKEAEEIKSSSNMNNFMALSKELTVEIRKVEV